MARSLKYRSDIAEAVHTTVEGFDDSCLTIPSPIEPKQIKKTCQSQ
jgi:hypothetical protein